MEPLEHKIVSGQDPFSDRESDLSRGGERQWTNNEGADVIGFRCLPPPFGLYELISVIENLNDDGQENKRNAAVVNAVTEAVAAFVAGIVDKDACLTKARAVFRAG